MNFTTGGKNPGKEMLCACVRRWLPMYIYLMDLMACAIRKSCVSTVHFNCVEKLRVPDRGARRVGDRARRGVMTGYPRKLAKGRSYT